MNSLNFEVSPLLTSPPPEEGPLNTGTLGSSASIEHDGLRFRSRTEIRVYEELKKRNVLFSPMPQLYSAASTLSESRTS
jgi:hypothetical protein